MTKLFYVGIDFSVYVCMVFNIVLNIYRLFISFKSWLCLKIKFLKISFYFTILKFQYFCCCCCCVVSRLSAVDDATIQKNHLVVFLISLKSFGLFSAVLYLTIGRYQNYCQWNCDVCDWVVDFVVFYRNYLDYYYVCGTQLRWQQTDHYLFESF